MCFFFCFLFGSLEGNAERFTVQLSSSQRVGVPFDINLKMEDCYGHPTKPPPQLQPELQCRWDINQYLVFFYNQTFQ